MRVILAICCVVGFALPVFADPVMSEKAPGAKKSFAESVAEAKTKMLNLEGIQAKLAETIYDSERNVNNAEKVMKSAQKDFNNAVGSPTAPLTDKQRDAYQKAQSDYKKAKDEFRPKILKAKAELAVVDKDLEALSQIVNTDRAEKYAEGIKSMAKDAAGDLIKPKLEALEKQNILLQSRMRNKDLRAAFNDLDLKTFGIENTLNDMEKLYDKSYLGAYLQDKFGQLLNSQVICSAVKRCGPTNPLKIESEKIRKELFPESEAVRSDYYEKVNKKQAPPVQ